MLKNFFFPSFLSPDEILSNTKIVIPWRESPSRKAIFDYLIEWYKKEFPEWEVVLSDSGSDIFNLSASRNSGIEKAFNLGADVVVVADADFFPSKDSLILSVKNAIKTNNITIPYTHYAELTYEATERFLKYDELSFKNVKNINEKPEFVKKKVERFWPCSGCNVITKKLFKKFGGFDENYQGWGQEDIDFHKRYYDKYKKLFDYIEGLGCSLEHDRSDWKTENSNEDYFKQKHGNSYIL